MCEPTSILLAASLAISVASGVAGYMGQDAQAKAQGNYQKDVAKSYNAAALNNANAAIKEQTEKSAAERTNQVQAQAATSQQLMDLKQERMKAQGTALASSQSSGTALDMLMADYNRLEAQKKDVMQEQLRMKGVSSDFAVSGYRDQAEAHINSQQGFVASPVGQPSWALTALGIGGSAFDDYNIYSYRKEARKIAGGGGGTSSNVKK